MDSLKTRAILALLLTMMFWGSASVVMRTLALSLSPENSLALRYVFIVAINATGLAITGGWRIARADWWRFLVAGLAGMGGYNIFVNAGFALVPAGVGAIITMVEPMMIAILAFLLLGESISSFLIGGVVLAFAGGLVLFWPQLATEVSTAIPARGVGYLMLCCFGWAIYTVVSKPLLSRYSSFTVTAMTMLIASPLLFALASRDVVTLAQGLTARQWLEVFYLVVPNGLLGTMLWNYGSKHLSSGLTGSTLYLIPVLAVTNGALFLGEEVTGYVVAGGLLILAGVAVAQLRPARRVEA